MQAPREAIVVALPQLCVEGFDVSVGGRALDDDEGVVTAGRLVNSSSHGGYPWGWDSGTVTPLSSGGSGEYNLTPHPVVSLQQDVSLDVSANSRGLSVLALREAGREVSEAGLLDVTFQGNVSLGTLYLDAGVPIDCVSDRSNTPLRLVLLRALWR